MSQEQAQEKKPTEEPYKWKCRKAWQSRIEELSQQGTSAKPIPPIPNTLTETLLFYKIGSRWHLFSSSWWVKYAGIKGPCCQIFLSCENQKSRIM